jgi:hypothetical protein
MFTELLPHPPRRNQLREPQPPSPGYSPILAVILLLALLLTPTFSLQAQQQQLDFGDAPQGYPTLLANNGARHFIIPNFFLGSRVDAESDGQPNAAATGDDSNPASLDDEDGVRFTSPLVPGQIASVEVVVTASAGVVAHLDAWIDFNHNLSWADPTDYVFSSVALNAGTNILTFNVPSSALAGVTFARFRLTREGFRQFDGLAPDGEVEDYQVTIGNPNQQPRCDESCRGTEFWLTFPGNYAPDPANPPQLSLCIIGTPGTTGNVSIARLQAPGHFCADFNDGLLPAGTIAFGTTPPTVNAARALVLTSNGQGGNQNYWAIPLGATQTFHSFKATWKTLLNGLGGADGISFNVGMNLGTNGAPFTPEEGATNGLSVTIDTYNNGGGEVGIEIRWNGARMSFTPIGGGTVNGPPVLETGTFVNDSVDVTATGFVTFTHGAFTTAAFIPGFTGITANMYMFAGRTGGASEDAFIDDVCINDYPFSQDFTIPVGMQALVSLPSIADLGDANDLIEDKGIHVTSSQPVSVHGLNHVEHTTDGYLGLPLSVVGNEYIVQGFGNVNSGIPPLNGTQFAIVATESNTVVTITPSTTTGVRDQAIPYNIILQPGQTYQLRNTNDAPADLSGTLISSDKPISVFGGHRCGNVNSVDSFFCDYLVEHLLPVRSWGTDFLLSRIATRSGYAARFLASVDNTTVTVNGGIAATLDRGAFYETNLAVNAHVTANHPIFVSQYANSSDVDNVINADPFMVTVPATKLFNANQVVCTGPAAFGSHYLNVIAPSGITGFVLVDGVGGFLFSPIPTSAYSVAQVPVAAGVHTISAPSPVGVTVYGWAEYDAYGWPGCLYFGDVTPPTVNCNAQDMTFFVTGDAAGGCTVQVPDLRSRATATDNCTDIAGVRIDQDPAPGTLLGPGVYPITVTGTDPSGNVGFCRVTLTVIDPSAPTIICPPAVDVNCAESGQIHPQMRVSFQVSARTTCISNLAVTCTPPSGSLFPLGTTWVNCVAQNNGQIAQCSFPVNVCTVNVSRPSPNVAVFSWASGGVLQKASDVTGPWSNVANASSPYQVTINPQQPAEFFRVKF